MDNESGEIEFTYGSTDYVAVTRSTNGCQGCAFNELQCYLIIKRPSCNKNLRKDGIDKIFVKK